MRYNIMYLIRRSFHFFRFPDKRKKYIARKLIGFSEDQIYSVVADVKNYEQFVPFCLKSTILSETSNKLLANLEIGFPPIYENYTSTVHLQESRLVQAICKDGKLFKYLETTWRFSPALKTNQNSCIVDFRINFEFKSKLYSHVASMFFDRLCREMEVAFFEEARRRFGKASIPSHSLDVVKS